MKTLAICTALVGLVATPVLAGPADAPTQKVSLAGLDLGSVEGQRQLDRRIDRAAREVCRADYVPTGTRITPAGTRDCVEKARASAQSQVAAIVADRQRGG